MAPNERGACSVCLTLEWECICEDYHRPPKKAKTESPQPERRATPPNQASDTELEESDSGSQQDFEDVVERAQLKELSYGILWLHFGEIAEAKLKALTIASLPEVQAFYIGVCKIPASRFYEADSALCREYQRMYPLAVGKNMGRLEKQVIAACRGFEHHGVSVAPTAPCKNKGPGGEKVHRKSVRFLYIAVKMPVSWD